jgi:hypothetical protein
MSIERSEEGDTQRANENPHEGTPYMRQGPLLTWSADMPIAVFFSKEQATEAEEKMGSVLLCVHLPRAALFRTADECRRSSTTPERHHHTVWHRKCGRLYEINNLAVAGENNP